MGNDYGRLHNSLHFLVLFPFLRNRVLKSQGSLVVHLFLPYLVNDQKNKESDTYVLYATLFKNTNKKHLCKISTIGQIV